MAIRKAPWQNCYQGETVGNFKNAVFSIQLNGYPYAHTKYLSGEPKLICAYTLLVCTIFAPPEIKHFFYWDTMWIRIVLYVDEMFVSAALQPFPGGSHNDKSGQQTPIICECGLVQFWPGSSKVSCENLTHRSMRCKYNPLWSVQLTFDICRM